MNQDFEKNEKIRRMNELNEINSEEPKINRKNKKYENDLNGQLKESFVKLGERISEETKITYENFMRKVSDYEVAYSNGRDLYSFSYDEILAMLTIFSSSSVNTLGVYRSIISKYIDIAIEQNYLSSNINPANNITYEDLQNIVNKTKKDKRIVTREEIYNMVEENIKNYQDQAILLLTFEGIKGKDCSELEQLLKDDFNFEDSTIKFERDGIEFVLNIPKRLSHILYQVVLEKEYKRSNGNYAGTRGSDTYELVDSKYLFRPTIQKNELDLPYLRGRNIQIKMIKCLKNENFLGLPYVTPTSLYLSGVIDRLKKYSKEVEHELSHLEVAKFLEEHHEKLNSFQTYSAYKEEIAEA